MSRAPQPAALLFHYFTAFDRELCVPRHSFRSWLHPIAYVTLGWFALALDTTAAQDVVPNRVGSCPLPARQSIPLPTRSDATARITADRAELGESGRSQMRGNVRIEQQGRAAEADLLDYDRKTGDASLAGNVRIADRNLSVQADSAQMNLNSSKGEFTAGEYQINRNGGRGRASTLNTDGAGRTNLRQGEYTTCDEQGSAPAWKISASEIALDSNEGEGVAYNSVLRIKNVPVLYLPYFSFPLDDRRKSGFLAPRIGSSGNAGLDIGTPYYWNIAPNYDATFTPRIMSRRGFQFGSDFRYLWPVGRGQIDLEYLPEDEVANRDRYFGTLTHSNYLGRNASLAIDYRRVSDVNYFTDLDTTLNSAAATHLPQQALIQWQPSRWFSAQALASDYQSLTPSIAKFDRPYARLPQIRLRARTPYYTGLGFDIESEAARFEHDDPTRPEGTRYDLRPAGTYVFDNGGNFVRSELALRYTGYQLDVAGTALTDGSLARTLPTFSLDMGQRYRRPLANNWVQTFEPRAHYLYTPFRNQSDLPIFDSGDPDFEFAQLFVDNRYTGIDRIGDANQLTFAGTTRLIDGEDGMERLSFSIGEILRFERPRVSLFDPVTGLTNSVPLDRSHSDLVSALEYRFTREWSLGLAAQIDPDDGDFGRGNARLRYRDDTGRLVALSYRFRESLLEQTDFSAAVPLSPAWAVIGRYNYSLRDSTDLESLIGLQYRSCCWAVTTAARRYLLGSLEHTEAIFVQFELTGLARVGDDFSKLLVRDTLRNGYY